MTAFDFVCIVLVFVGYLHTASHRLRIATLERQVAELRGLNGGGR